MMSPRRRIFMWLTLIVWIALLIVACLLLGVSLGCTTATITNISPAMSGSMSIDTVDVMVKACVSDTFFLLPGILIKEDLRKWYGSWPLLILFLTENPFTRMAKSHWRLKALPQNFEWDRNIIKKFHEWIRSEFQIDHYRPEPICLEFSSDVEAHSPIATRVRV